MRRALCVAAFALLALTLSLLARESGAEGASPGGAPAPTQFVPQLGLPATEVVAFGASPAEAPNEAWAYGYLGDVPPAGAAEQTDRYTLLEHGADGSWQSVALPTGPAGEVAKRPDTFPSKLGALSGQSTPAGSVVLLTDPGIVVRDPAGAPRLVPAPSGAELLGAGETVPPSAPPEGAPTPYAAYDPAPGKAGVLIAPYGDGAGGGTPGVLDYNGLGWSREPIEAGGEPVRPLAIACGPTTSAPGADSGENCWLLAALGSSGGKLGLFRRGTVPTGGTGPGGAVGSEGWAPVSIEGGLLAGGSGASLGALPGNAQMLTATSQGVWVDFAATIGGEAPRSASELVEPTGSGSAANPTAKVAGSWCYPTGPGCEASLGAAFPTAYRSFAWPGASAEDPGRRIVTGFPDRSALELDSGSFAVTAGPGGSPGIAPGGAAFATPELGFLADGVDPDSAPDGAGQSQVIEVTVNPEAPQTATEPVPFRRPLTAVAMNPAGTGEALGVGLGGEFARFDPRFGWHQETAQKINTEGLASGQAEGNPEESLLGVTWPTPERAYAVGADGGIWTWTSAGGVWQPALPPSTNAWNSIAFSPSEPSRVYAAGNLGILGVESPATIFFEPFEPAGGPSEKPPSFTSIAFAGNEGIAAWHTVDTETGHRKGGISVNDGSGSGWVIEPAVEELIDALPGRRRWPTKVAGLPDGGAVVAGPGFVLKRESAKAKWRFSSQPLPEAGNIAALGAYRDADGTLRAVVSVDLGPRRETVPTAQGTSQEPLPASGYLLRETADGWSDVEHAALPVKEGSAEMPQRPEPTLGFAVSADGKSILGVGGQTGTFDTSAEPKVTEYETAAAIQSPASAVVDPDESSPLAGIPGAATLVLGGNAACTAPCAAQAADGLGPDRSLSHALTRARELAAGSGDLRDFVYTGGRLEAGAGEPGFEAELTRLASIFSAGSPTPVLTTPSPDLTAGGGALFASAFSGFGPTAGSTPYYSVRSEPGGNAAPVEVIVLDLSSGELGGAQEAWLRRQLASAQAANVPTMVFGNAVLGLTLPDPPLDVPPPAQVKDPEALAQILVEGHASIYLFDYPGASVFEPVANRILGIGTGTLGYGKPGAGAEDWLGSNDLLFFEILPALGPGATGFGFGLRAVPNIESLTLHGRIGPRLAAGEAEYFEGLGRTPAGGIRLDQSGSSSSFGGPEPYDTLPFPSKALKCEGPNCRYSLGTEYFFSSSQPEVGDFIPAPGEFQGSVQLRSDPFSGFFCAKKPGTTTISITAGGLSYSTLVEVTAGEGGEGCALPTSTSASNSTERIEPPSGEAQPSAPSTSPPTPIHHGGGVTPSPTPTHPHPSPTSSSPTPPAPVATPTVTGPVSPQALTPVVSPHPPPGPQPAPPTGISSAAQPVTQAANAPGVVPAPGLAPGQEQEEEAAIQQQHMAVRAQVGRRAEAIPGAGSNSGSGSIPLAILLLGPAALLAVAGGIGVSASAAAAASLAYPRGHDR